MVNKVDSKVPVAPPPAPAKAVSPAPAVQAPVVTSAAPKQGMSTGAKVGIGVGVGCCVLIVGGIGILVALFGWAVLTGDFSKSTPTPTLAPTKAATKGPTVIPTKSFEGFAPYLNCKYSYSLQYPEGWTDEQLTGNEDQVLFSADKTALGIFAFEGKGSYAFDQFISEREKVIKGTRKALTEVTWMNTKAFSGEYTMESGDTLLATYWFSGNFGMQASGTTLTGITQETRQNYINMYASLRANVRCIE